MQSNENNDDDIDDDIDDDDVEMIILMIMNVLVMLTDLVGAKVFENIVKQKTKDKF